MINLCSLRSGSSGNAVLVATESTKILIDCGVSGKSIASSLAELDIPADDINAILITHEHSDHVQAAGIMSRRHNIPIYANEDTWKAMLPGLGKIKDECIKVFASDFEIGDIGVKPFSIPHDAANPVGYSFLYGSEKCSIATDMGHVTPTVFDAIKGSQTVLLESNHDINMLEVGSYPYYLKRRIRGNHGHLSNEDAAKLAVMLTKSGTTRFLLGHLSKENNIPQLAFETSRTELESNGIVLGKDVLLAVAERSEISCLPA